MPVAGLWRESDSDARSHPSADIGGWGSGGRGMHLAVYGNGERSDSRCRGTSEVRLGMQWEDVGQDPCPQLALPTCWSGLARAGVPQGVGPPAYATLSSRKSPESEETERKPQKQDDSLRKEWGVRGMKPDGHEGKGTWASEAGPCLPRWRAQHCASVRGVWTQQRMCVLFKHTYETVTKTGHVLGHQGNPNGKMT